jgi:hypothetical protein
MTPSMHRFRGEMLANQVTVRFAARAPREPAAIGFVHNLQVDPDVIVEHYVATNSQPAH